MDMEKKRKEMKETKVKAVWSLEKIVWKSIRKFIESSNKINGK